MKIAGVDCSTKKVTLFFIEDKAPTSFGSSPTHRDYVVELTEDSSDTSERIDKLFHKVKNLLMDEKPTMVYVENSPYLQNIKVTLMIHSVVDAVRFACVSSDTPFQTVEVTSWKKDVLGNGKADKSTIMTFAKAKWGEELITNQDLADASCIATYGQLRVNKNLKNL